MKLINRVNLDRLFLVYGLIVTISLTTGAILNLNDNGSLISLFIFLPVTLFYFYEGLLTLNRTSHRFLNHNQPEHHRYFAEFRLKTFFDQSEPSFLLSLILLSFAFALSLIRLSLTILK